MKKFTGSETLALLKQRAEARAFESWDRGSWPLFTEYVWLRTQWTQWYWAGIVYGAIAIREIRDLQEESLGEYQCLQHHFCVEREAGREPS